MKQERKLGDCLDEAKKTICGERQDVYGSPEDSFALIADYWNIYISGMSGSALVAQDVAHMMILFKMARVQGQAPKRDNYVDLCGYAAIAADRFHPEEVEDDDSKRRTGDLGRSNLPPGGHISSNRLGPSSAWQGKCREADGAERRDPPGNCKG